RGRRRHRLGHAVGRQPRRHRVGLRGGPPTGASDRVVTLACRAHDRPVGASVEVEEAKGFSKVLDPNATSYAADVLCRGILETASLVWWLLDPDIDAQRRLARSLVYRLHTAAQTGRAIEALALDP